jgi:pilus assembly protein Flp/PilA
MSVLSHIKRFLRDENGAALLEYTVLIGLLLTSVLVAIASIATWIGGKWTALNSNLNG